MKPPAYVRSRQDPNITLIDPDYLESVKAAYQGTKATYDFFFPAPPKRKTWLEIGASLARDARTDARDVALATKALFRWLGWPA